MANVAHSTLTGSDLHEPKGAAAATANKVYVSDGAGSGAWTATSTLNPFSNALLHFRDERTPGSAGDAYTSGDWRTVSINLAVTNQISGASIASNQITLPAGTYFIDATVVHQDGRRSLLKLRNVTDSSNTLVGLRSTQVNAGGAVTCGFPTVRGVFTIAAQKTFELQIRVSQTSSATEASSFSVNEVYTDGCIWKTA